MFVPEDGENLSEKTREAYSLYRSGNFAQAVETFKKEAKGGDEAAIFALGALLQEGRTKLISGSPEDYFTAAAKKDYAPAQFNLARMLVVDPERVSEGVSWMEKAAENGSRKGMLFCAVSSLEGASGFEKDPAAALKWLTKADEAGVPEAKLYLGRMYQAGFGVEKDVEKAKALVSEAADTGLDDALHYLASSYLSGGLGEKSSEKALELFRKGAGQEDGRIFQLALGGLYENGQGVEKDYSKALFWYDKAVSSGDAAAYNKLGFFHERGMGVPADEAKALEFYKRGAEAGVAVSMYNVAQMHDSGKGMAAPDQPEAARWLYKAANTGMGRAQLELANRYLSGNGLMEDKIAAAAWLERASQSGYPQAQLRFAQLLEGGDGIPRSMLGAARWYQSAARAGLPEAMFRLGQLYEQGIGTAPNPMKALGYYLGAAGAGHEAATERRDYVSTGLSEERRGEAEAFRNAGFKVPVKESAETEE